MKNILQKKLILVESMTPMRVPFALTMIAAALLVSPDIGYAANECGIQNGSTPVVCPGGKTYAGGITYGANGNLFLSVPATPTGNLILTGEGINASATGTTSLSFDSSAYLGQIRGQGGIDAVLDFSSEAGDITISSTQISGTQSGGAQIGIRALSGLGTPAAGDGGDIAISAASAQVSAGGTGILANTDGGNITITGLAAGGGAIGGNAAGMTGIRAETSGTGTISMNLGATNNSARVLGGAGAAAIHAIADSDITINSNRLVFAASGSTSAVGIVTDTGGVATINNTRLLWGNSGIAVRGIGGSTVVNLSVEQEPTSLETFARMDGGVDFTGLTAGAEVNVGHNGMWVLSGLNSGVRQFNGVSRFSAGDDRVEIAETGYLSTVISTGLGEATLGIDEDIVVIDFGDGNDIFVNRGKVLLATVNSTRGSNFIGYETELRMEGLETFVNSGTILFGSTHAAGRPTEFTDETADDILSLPGATFHGEGGRVVLDIDLNLVGQDACNRSVRLEGSGNLPVSDCIDLAGGAATGRTEVVLNVRVPGDRGPYVPNGNVLVDMAGGDPAETDPNAFVLSPDNAGYVADIGNGAIDKGLFFYTIAHDSDANQFRLYGLPGSGAQQMPLYGQAANELWRTSISAWFDHQNEQRSVKDQKGAGGGAWVRAAATSTDRDLITSVGSGSVMFDFDNTYTQRSTTLTFGRDLVHVGERGQIVTVGAMIGYARTRLNFAASPNYSNLEGMHLGLYGSYDLGSLFVDAAINSTWLQLNNDVPAFNLFPSGTVLDTKIQSLGAQVEAGWHFRLSEMLEIEPLAGFAFVSSSTDGVSVPADDPARFGGEIGFEDTDSVRASLGLRLSLQKIPGLPGGSSFALTARQIEELEGQSVATIANTGPEAAVVSDTFDGSFSKLSGALTLANERQTAAGYLNVDALIGDNYDSLGVTAGFRFQW